MDLSIVMPILVSVGVIIGIILGILALFKAFYIKVEQGQALIVNDMSPKPKVHFTGAMVLPVIHKKEVMQISVITLEIDRRGKDGLICKDNMRADITVALYLRVNETPDDVLRVAKAVGVDRASSKAAVNELFNAKFSEALKTVGKKMDFLDLFENRIGFRDRIVEVIGDDLNGYVLEDVAIDYLEQTPKAQLDPTNILDSEGIRKITEITAGCNVETNRLERDEELAVKKKNVDAQEQMLELDKQKADAEARQKREIETIQAREEAETLRVKEEERLKSEQARIETDEKLAIQEENKQRQIEVAAKNRERTIAIEEERVEKARELEAVNREREVAIESIQKDKAVEEEKKIIANTVSERIAVERKVAEEEENIKDVQRLSEAERHKKERILDAEAEAQEELVKEVKRAEAEEQKATHKAREVNTMAQADLEASSKRALAQEKEAEGQKALEAAPGLAKARVMEAMAEAKERDGLAEANANQARGLAEAKIIAEQAEAIKAQGLSEAVVIREKKLAEAEGLKQLGIAEAEALRLKGKAEADTLRDKGVAEAETVRERGIAEAEGLVQKFKALNNMDPGAIEFERFRMQLEVDLKQMLEAIEANKSVAKDQAEVLSAALSNANIDLVGGEGDYFNSFAKSLGLGKAIEGMLEKSPHLKSGLSKLVGLADGMSEPADTSAKSDGAK
ncbi:MAG: hypothetical protein MI864_10095 [Pseudomonadales bacterium]|nr:hypothetical protein [Pseudomonadales bacterium]